MRVCLKYTFWILMSALVFTGVSSFAGMTNVVPLTGGGSAEEVNSIMYNTCVSNYQRDLSQCQSDCTSTSNSLYPNPGICIDACMKDALYPDGTASSATSYCMSTVYQGSTPAEEVTHNAMRNSGGPNSDPCNGSSSSLCEARPAADRLSVDDTVAAIPQPPAPPAPHTDDPPIPRFRPDQPWDNWAQESSQDIQQCSSSQSTANTCCNNPSSCTSDLSDTQRASYQALIQQAQSAQSSGNTASLQQICQQSRSMSVNSGNVNTGFANVCYSKRTTCSQTCSTAFSKWQQRQSNCGSQCSLVNNTLAQLDSKRSTCNSYASLENQIRAQSSASAEQARLAQICADQTSLASTETPSPETTPQQSGGNNNLLGSLNQGAMAGLPALGALGSARPAQDSPPAGEDPSAQYCSLNPNAPSCYVAPQFTGGDASSVQASNGSSEPSSYEDFNVGADNNMDVHSGQTYQPEGTQPTPAQGHAVTNGGAGGVPGGDSSANLASAASAEGQNLPAMLGSGVNPNILHGEGGASGYSNPVGSSGNEGSGFDFKNRFKFPGGAKASAKNYKGLDLKKYLPGGVNDPRRGLAGLSDFHPDIGPKHVSFFTRVSTRIKTLCRLKKLLDCQ